MQIVGFLMQLLIIDILEEWEDKQTKYDKLMCHISKSGYAVKFMIKHAYSSAVLHSGEYRSTGGENPIFDWRAQPYYPSIIHFFKISALKSIQIQSGINMSKSFILKNKIKMKTP